MRRVILEKAGIAMAEFGPNSLYFSVVLKNNIIKAVFSIDQSDLGGQFTAAAHGKPLLMVKVIDELKKIAPLHVIRSKYGDNEDYHNDDVVRG